MTRGRRPPVGGAAAGLGVERVRGGCEMGGRGRRRGFGQRRPGSTHDLPVRGGGALRQCFGLECLRYKPI